MFGKKKKKNDFPRNKQLLTAFDRMEYFIIAEKSNEGK